jgi:ferric-dicitrate binding protein FerR (iron transport regulator)
MQDQDAKKLLRKYREGKATKEEIILLLNSIRDFEIEGEVEFTVADLEAAKEEMRRHLSLNNIKPIKKLWPRIAAAATIILCLSISGYFILQKQSSRQIAQSKAHDIAPGGNNAILTLANGKQIVLNAAKKGQIAEQGNAGINKTADGEVVYNTTPSETSDTNSEIEYNVMTTPRGGQYTLRLADGTKVMLNAASSLKYPASFFGKERKVELTGEAYFEVAHNKAKPFKVESKGQTVEVLGTHFNINSYSDEPAIKTTLLEGSVKITCKNNTDGKVLSPSQASYYNGHSINVIPVNAEADVTWKNGFFTFKKADIKTVMRQFSRWYNIDVIYEGKASDVELTGDVYRNVNLSEALKILSYFNIQYRSEGNKIIITS